MLLIEHNIFFLVICGVLLCIFTFLVRCCDPLRLLHKSMFSLSLPPVICRRLMSHLRYLCLLAHSGVQHILCCVLCFACLRLVYPMLPVSLDCPFLIAPSSCVLYVASVSGLSILIAPSSCVPYVTSFSGLSIFGCPFDVL